MSFSPTRWSSRTDALVLALLAGLYFVLNIDFRLGGDAATYATFILLGKFNELSLHIGYYAVAWVLHHTIGRAFGIPIHETLVYLNVVSGALTIAVSYALARRLIGTRLDGILAAVFMALCGRVVMNSGGVEIYMLQTLLSLWAMLLYVDDHFFGAGAAASAAMLVSPLSAFAFLFFPAYELTRSGRANWRGFATMLAGGTVLYLPYLAVLGHELLYGRRGLLVIRDVVPIQLSALILNVPKYQFKHYTTLLLFLVPAVMQIRKHRRLAILSAAVILPHFYIVAKLTLEDNTFIQNTDFFFVCWLVLGARYLLERFRSWILVAVPIAGHVGLLAFSGSLIRVESYRAYDKEMRALSDTYLRGKQTILVTDWGTGIAITHYGRDSVVSVPENDPLYQQIYDITARDPSAMPPLDGKEILVLDTWTAGPLNRLLRSPESLARIADANSVVKIAQRNLGLTCGEIAKGTYSLYRCTR